jgi:hypothetical protein
MSHIPTKILVSVLPTFVGLKERVCLLMNYSPLVMGMNPLFQFNNGVD